MTQNYLMADFTFCSDRETEIKTWFETHGGIVFFQMETLNHFCSTTIWLVVVDGHSLTIKWNESMEPKTSFFAVTTSREAIVHLAQVLGCEFKELGFVANKINLIVNPCPPGGTR